MAWNVELDDDFRAEMAKEPEAVVEEVLGTGVFDDHLETFTPERRARIEARAKKLIEEELTLRELRRAEHLTQTRMAELMGVKQENISRLERRADLLLSTLASYVAAMGGRLRLVAEFPDRRPVAIALSDISGQEESLELEAHDGKRWKRRPARRKD